MIKLAGITAPFLRGDCNDDGTVDISDPTFTLNFLFAGGDDPKCREACNANGDDLDVSDAIYTLNFLFSGGPPPIGSYPDCDTAGPGDDCAEATCKN